MALKFNLNRVTADDIDAAKAEAATRGNRYSGPTPPDGVYKVKVGGVWLTEQKNGPALKVVFNFEGNEGDNAVYNGAGVFNNFTIPTDPGYQHFNIQVSTLDAFLKAVSKGTFDFADFAKAVNEGRVVTEEATGNMGEPVKQIGKLKLPSDSRFEIKTKLNTYQGRTNAALHYILDNSWERISSAGSDVDDDVAGLDSEPVDDLDDLLG